MPPQHRFLSKSLCLLDNDLGAVVLVTLLKGNISLTQKRSGIHKHQGKASGLCPKAGTVGGFPFPIPLLSFSNVRVEGKYITQHPALVLFSLACYFIFLLLSAVLHQKHRVQHGIKHGGHSPPWINKALTWKGSSTVENGKNKSLGTSSSGLRRRS